MHLCSESPCTLPDPGRQVAHARRSAGIDPNVACDVSDLAKQGCWGRCWKCSRWTMTLATLPCSWCSRRLKTCRRRRRLTNGASGPVAVDLDPNSESESEIDGGECEAVRVAYEGPRGALALSSMPCKDAARREPLLLLHEDAAISDVADKDKTTGAGVVRICHHHASLYEAQRSKRCCAKEGCHHTGRHSRDGIRLCTHHAQPKGVRWRERSQTPPRSRRDTADEEAQQQIPAQTIWVAYVRDPGALAAAGMEAYYRYEAFLGDKTTIGNGELSAGGRPELFSPTWMLQGAREVCGGILGDHAAGGVPSPADPYRALERHEHLR